MTSKQRAYLKSLAMKEKPIINLGKASLTDENAANVDEALTARELVKIGVLQNCMDDPREIADALAVMTRSEVVQVIGKKIVLYREAKDKPKEKRIQLPVTKK
ncbi:MAG: ribosome assembly RNA-binding protein YhbY [Lachnospiraceae bacterium]|nr:ribosome assembly RNA-binding protein YhbY [Candidatus Equihabitans merdae]